jgi:cytoplasmic iron level regulating protein YaaA (DUF328/UPF0246 family)
VLIVLPPSETKRPAPDDGAPVDLANLSFPALTPMRERVIEALIETSADADAFARLHVRPTFASDIARNTRLLELPAIPAADVYTGPLHRGIEIAGLSPAARAYASHAVVITSPVWGALRPDDRIPPYRCDLFVSLLGMGRLDHFWRGAIADVLADAAGQGLVVDLRSPTFQQIGMPAGAGERTVVLRVEPGPPGARLGDVVTKRVRGEAARFLLESGSEPAHPVELADVLGDGWPVALDGPERPGRPWTLSLSVER